MGILKKTFGLLISFVVLSPVSSLYAANQQDDSHFDTLVWKPYIGFDLQSRNMDFVKDNGRDSFKKSLPQVNPYIGVKLNPYFAVEGGAYVAQKKKVTVTKTHGEVFLGFPVIGVDDSMTYTNFAKIRGWHLNIVGFLPLHETSPFQLYGTAGISRVNMNFVSIVKATDGNEAVPLTWSESEREITFKASKYVPRLGAGMQYLVSDRIGLRAGFVWEKTSNFSRRGRFSLQNLNNTVKPRNTFIYNLGFFVNI